MDRLRRQLASTIIGYRSNGAPIYLIMGGSTDDRGKILLLPEVAEITRKSEATHRWLHHVGRGPRLWKLGKRLVCYESDLRDWLDAQYAAEEANAS